MKLTKNIQSIAKAVLEQEAQAVQQLTERIDETFVRCVHAILDSGGRVVATGVGKSAIIGQKIVATLNSTGTPALFMHAADAIHGDLGMIQPADIALVISKSGDTSEIKVIVPLLKRLGVRMIALVSNADSYLATHAHYVLHAYAPREADPLNLAPTTSTTAALALGDALAVCLLEARGFTPHDFARFHPGGALGKKLYLKVSDLYPQNACPIVAENATVKQIILEITSKRLGATAVVGATGTLSGIITDGDLRRMLNRYDADELLGLTARDVMTPGPLTIEPEAYAVTALQRMQERSITQLVVATGSRVEGFVHLHDLLKEGIV